MNRHVKWCKKCVLPEYTPDIRLNEAGVCNICREFEHMKSQRSRIDFQESQLLKLLKKYKGRAAYDCLVMCSGGKDSVFSLYCMKKRYKMNPLAFTFDHGFENEEALENVKRAVRILGVDWIYFRSDSMKDIFSRMIRTQTKAPVCHVCAIWYMQSTYDLAAKYKIPLIIGGWTKGQTIERGESGEEYRSMSQATADFVARHMRKTSRYKNFPLSMKEAICRGRKKFKGREISPHWYLPWDEEKIIVCIQSELQWRALRLSYPAGSTNCLMNFVSVYLTMKYYGYTHYHIELSKRIRLGEFSREEAEKKLAMNFGEETVRNVLKGIGCEGYPPLSGES